MRINYSEISLFLIFFSFQKATPHWSTARRMYLNIKFLPNSMTAKLHLIRNGKLAGLVTTRFYHQPTKAKIDFVERYALLHNYQGVNLWTELQLPKIG